ncbi:MAG: RecX family transcriptional regulator [Erysipelotrichaceae bacterium]|nr:RecX family transcriptional regulator [Erysipelotrichaceae bacterium]
MRIGMFCDSYLPDINGVVTSVVTLKKVLEDHGHEVWVVSNHPSFLKTEFDFDKHEIRLPGLELKKLYGYKASAPIHIKTLREIAKLKWDIIHAHSEFGVGIFGRIAANSLHLPVVSTYHTTYEDYTHYVNILKMDSIDKFAKLVIAKLSKLYGETCSAVIAPSQKTKDMLLRYQIKTPITVVPTGLDLKRFDPHAENPELIAATRARYQIKASDTLVLFIGRVAQEKSIDLLIEAFHHLPPERNDLKLMIVGSGPGVEDLQNLIMQYHLEDRVILAGKQYPEVIPLYYHCGDVFVSASLTETQGLTFIEALASGLPVLARPDGAVENLIYEDQNGYFFNQAEELAAVILRFSRLSPDRRQELSQAALTTAKAYDIDVFYQQVMAVYEDAIRRYSQDYRITDIKYQDDTVRLTLLNPSNEMTLLVTVDSFARYGLRKDKNVDKDLIAKLLEDELLVQAYKAAIKYLTIKDRTCQEMENWLQDHTALNKTQLQHLMDYLRSKKYLDDRRYAQTQAKRLLAQLMGKNRIRNELLNRGVVPEIINGLALESDNQQLQSAINYAKKWQGRIKDRSLAYKRNLLINKLIQYGYDVNIAKQALEQMDNFSDDVQEQVSLRKLANKAKTRYNRKYSGSMLRNHVYRYLTSQGFQHDDIYLVLNEMEWEDE